MTRMFAVTVLAVSLTACGITGPKFNFGNSETPIAQAEGPGVQGNLQSADGVTIASGSIYLNPAAGFATLMHYIGGWFNLGGNTAAATAQPQ